MSYKLMMIFFATSLLLAISCKKTAAPETTPVTYSPAVIYPFGNASSVSIQKTIGPAGGSISSADGKFSLIIPAGALSGNVEFAVQPVNNTAPIGAGNAYLVTPANPAFTKTATVRMHYNDSTINGHSEDALDIVTQDAVGIWKAMDKTTQNKTNRELVVQTSHLNYFAITGYYGLTPAKMILSAKDSTLLIVRQVLPADKEPGTEESPLGPVVEVTDAGAVGNWTNNGTGTIVVGTSRAVYTAPSSIGNAMETDISITLSKIKLPIRGYNSSITLHTHLYITSGNFFAGTYDGQPYNCSNASVASGGGITIVQGIVAGGKSITIYIHGTDIGNYPYGDAALAGKSEIRCNFSGDKIFETNYVECGPPSVTKYASGSIELKGGDSGGSTAGNFSATLYEDTDCKVVSKQVTGEFKIRKM